MYRRSSQRRTDYSRINSVERQRASHRLGRVSATNGCISCLLLTNPVYLVKNWVTASSTSCTALPLRAANFLTPSPSKHPTTALRLLMVTTTTLRDCTSTIGISTRRALLLVTSLASVSVSTPDAALTHDVLTTSKHTQPSTTPASQQPTPTRPQAAPAPAPAASLVYTTQSPPSPRRSPTMAPSPARKSLSCTSACRLALPLHLRSSFVGSRKCR